MTYSDMADERHCTIDGCDRKHAARGLCGTHWRQWRRGKLDHEAPLERVPGRTCEIEGCDQPHHARGLCGKHHVRLRKHGDPLHDTYWLMIWSRVDDSGECWLWTGPQTWNGYGHASFRRRSTTAHRAVYEYLVGSVPDGLDLDHLCRVRLCVNPNHLEPVTRAENMRRARSAAR